MNEDHAGHHIVSLAEGAGQERARLGQLCVEAKHHIDEMASKAASLRSRFADYQAKAGSLHADIDRDAHDFTLMIEHHRVDAHREVDARVTASLQPLEAMRDDLEVRVANWQSSYELVDSAIRDASDVGVFEADEAAKAELTALVEGRRASHSSSSSSGRSGTSDDNLELGELVMTRSMV